MGNGILAHDWHVLGAGAIGGLFACRLQQSGLPVSIIFRDAEQLDVYPLQGISIADCTKPEQAKPEQAKPEQTHEHARDRCRPRAVTAAQMAPQSIRQLLVATKAHHTEIALRSLAPALHSEVVVILLQNGMGVAESIQPLLPAGATLLQALTTEAVWRSAPFNLVHASRGRTHIGGSEADYDAAKTIAGQWIQAGFDTRAEADIAPHLWRKLAVNCAINPFTALYRCSNAELRLHPDWLPRRDRVLREIIDLAGLLGNADALVDIHREVDRVVEATAANRSSMFQDVLAQRTTEIDFMNGFVATRSASLGLSAPENSGLAIAIAALRGSA